MDKRDFVLLAVRQELTQEHVAWLFGQSEELIQEILQHLSLRRDWKGFDEDFEQKIWALDKPEEAFKQYVQYYICTIDKTLSPHNIRQLSHDSQEKMLGIKKIAGCVRAFAEYHELCDKAMLMLFDDIENFKAYIHRRRLNENGMLKMFHLPDTQREKFFTEYILHYRLSRIYEIMMLKKFSLNSPALLCYVERYGLRPEVSNYLMVVVGGMIACRGNASQPVEKIPS